MTPRESEADARIAIDDRLRQAGWDPLDKSAVRAEVSAGSSSRPSGLVARGQARPYETHAPVYELVAAAGSFGPDRTLGADVIEAAVLDRDNGRRTFRRLTDDEITAAIGSPDPDPEPEPADAADPADEAARADEIDAVLEDDTDDDD